jgi:hypothetical protein
MPRSPEIPEFAEKLRVMLDRFSLSRVQFAQLAGVDKSVSGRWVAGQARPGEQSIVRLTDIVRREVTRRMELAGSRVRGAAGPVCAFAPARPRSLPSRQPPMPALPMPRPRRRSASFACWPKRPATRIGLAISS